MHGSAVHSNNVARDDLNIDRALACRRAAAVAAARARGQRAGVASGARVRARVKRTRERSLHPATSRQTDQPGHPGQKHDHCRCFLRLRTRAPKERPP